ncbi:LIRP-like isoform X2 [Phymastichus coffea]|nr:LIRP-like isoform X2 [Phymastichus coffea]XP_058789501.1 LIRP-like isoform X2 [Phymastichus coffea]XP_058789502.1 LIRP-like isoform X2 [Phymastichus coffea]XP_058789504.1 LIRP-like isoform X2 [Phymastichus coffea]XP_058789505.1 LIRP-like isoform X2 [Phymastichus coffea]
MSTYRLAALLMLTLVSLIMVQSSSAELPLNDYELIVKRQGMSKYCGKHLVNTLQLICHGLYNTMFKRDQEMDLDDYPSYDDSYPFRSRARARAMMMGRFGGSRYRRQSRGVHDECCVKSCSVAELVSYCASPS